MYTRPISQQMSNNDTINSVAAISKLTRLLATRFSGDNGLFLASTGEKAIIMENDSREMTKYCTDIILPTNASATLIAKVTVVRM